jgi:hypothetical protein
MVFVLSHEQGWPNSCPHAFLMVNHFINLLETTNLLKGFLLKLAYILAIQ